MALTGDFTSGQTVAFSKMRQLLMESGGGLQEGVVGGTDLMVTQRGAGANLSVDVAAGAGWIQVDSGTRNGLSHVYNDATANVVVNAADAINPRIDQVGVQYNDTAIPAGTGGNTPTLRYLAGTPTAGATLANRTGATTLPNDFLLLADFLVPATATTVTNANIRDRRKFGRGAFNRIVRTAGSYTTTGTTLAAVDTANLQPRIECAGVAVRLTLMGTASQNTANSAVKFGFFVDGSGVDSSVELAQIVPGFAATAYGFVCSYVVVPAAGSHTFAPTWAVSGGTGTLNAATANPLVFTVEELVRPNLANNSVTSG